MTDSVANSPDASTDAPTRRGTAQPQSRQEALAGTLVEIEAHIDQLGWDRPVLVFALARTLTMLESDPDVAKLLPQEACEEAQANPEALTAVLQEELPVASTLDELLGQLTWPEHIEGAAICTESTVVPAEVDAQALAITDPQERQDFLAAHQERQDVRILAAAMRSGENWCVMRTRGQSQLLQGENLVPQLVEGLRGTFA
ncbi:Uncharacterised protein [Actinomyces bovis]|uniref:Uncharacterized protein n=1 Tax=Actinomyces bovis TaxID=1658 RepID=A0ABY1VKX8_9ACTO|nr:PPA1309 family protein [Actinomyces bovis]SPT52755.1 Uncharacterised protein [Actinomyces bovis]VEG54755.1 Uncharacterised protein [Actinomyces israelii]